MVRAGRNTSNPFRFHGRGYYGPYVYGYPGVFAGGYGPYAYGDTAGIADAANGDVAAPIAPDTMAVSNQPSPRWQNELARVPTPPHRQPCSRRVMATP